MNFRKHIIRDPQIRNGVPVIKGTEITLKTVLGHFFLGDSIENIIKTYPGLTTESLTAVIAYAAGIAGLDIPEDSPFREMRPQTLTKSKVLSFTDLPDPSKVKLTHLLSDSEVSGLLSSLDFKKDEK